MWDDDPYTGLLWMSSWVPSTTPLMRCMFSSSLTSHNGLWGAWRQQSCGYRDLSDYFFFAKGDTSHRRPLRFEHFFWWLNYNSRTLFLKSLSLFPYSWAQQTIRSFVSLARLQSGSSVLCIGTLGVSQLVISVRDMLKDKHLGGCPSGLEFLLSWMNRTTSKNCGDVFLDCSKT